LYDIINGVMSTMVGYVKDKPIDLVKEVPTGLPLVFADPKRLRQILLNILSNAAKFTHDGSVVVRVSRHKEQPERDLYIPHVQIAVEDTGIGIDERDIPLLFEPFRQVDGSTTRQVGGTGLGLPITKEFIEMMGGSVWVESEVGVGTTFTFTVPLEPPTDPDAVMLDTTGEEDYRPVILAVDDEPKVLELYNRYLQAEGFAMVGVNTAVDLEMRVYEVEPVAILLDIQLPEKSGWDALEDLKANDGTRHIPVIVCSIEEDRERGAQLGAEGYLTKPIDEEDLLNEIEKVMEKLLAAEEAAAARMPAPAESMAMPEPERIQTEAPLRPNNLTKVLVIDPDEAYAAALEELLEITELYDVQVTHKGFEGLGVADKANPKTIIIDLDIPDMDGIGLIVAMRSNPSTNDVPIIILTERELGEEQLETIEDGMTLYLNKLDYDAESLLETLHEAIEFFTNSHDD
ncbi:MAG: response regulator, partial [Chloroflexi bacterium]|nr:response regulator [Chloroflexota bacterium]